MSRLIFIAGIGVVGLYLIILITYRTKIAPEIILFCSFIIWAALTGAIVAKNQTAFRDSISTLFQIMLLMFAVSGFSRYFGSIKPNLYILLISIVILDCYVIFSGGGDISGQLQSTLRTSSFLKNPNYYAFYNVIGVFTLLFFTHSKRKASSKILHVFLMVLFLISILFSSSQKAFLGVILLFMSWYWFCLRKNTKKNRRFLNFVLLSAFLFGFVYLALNNTFIGLRLQDSVAGQDASLQTRLLLYKEGWKLFLANPIAGVGIANFVEYSSMHAYAHSDFLEVLTTSGIIGFILYVSLYILFWKHLSLIQKMTKNPVIFYQTGLFKSFIVTITFIGLGRPNFTSIETMFVLASLIGYSTYLLSQVKRENIIFVGQKTNISLSVPRSLATQNSILNLGKIDEQ